jgi:hypothetical protein
VRVFVSDGHLRPCEYWRTSSFSIVTQVNVYSFTSYERGLQRSIELPSSVDFQRVIQRANLLVLEENTVVIIHRRTIHGHK